MNETSGNKETLTSSRFENLLKRLDPDRAAAGAHYEDLRWQLRKFFEWNCASQADDLVDETLDRTARKLEEEEVRDVVAFAWGVAGNVRLEANRRVAKMVAIVDAFSEDELTARDTEDMEQRLHAKIDQERKLECLHRCLQQLSDDDRKLFVGYYRLVPDPVRTRQRLAAGLGLTINALRVRVNRVRDRVESCVDARMSISGRARLKGKPSL